MAITDPRIGKGGKQDHYIRLSVIPGGAPLTQIEKDAIAIRDDMNACVYLLQEIFDYASWPLIQCTRANLETQALAGKIHKREHPEKYKKPKRRTVHFVE